MRPDLEAVEAVLTWKAPKTDTQLMSFLEFANYYREFIKGYADKIYPMQRLMRNKGKKFTWTDEAQVLFENIKRELCEAPVLGMPTEEGVFVLDTDASVVAISGILSPEIKYGAPKAEMFAVITFVEKYRAYLGSAPFKLRVDNRALAWLKTFDGPKLYWSLDRAPRWIPHEHRTRQKQQNAGSLSKNTESMSASRRSRRINRKSKTGFHSWTRKPTTNCHLPGG